MPNIYSKYPCIIVGKGLHKADNYMRDKVWGKIIYPFLNFIGCTVEV